MKRARQDSNLRPTVRILRPTAAATSVRASRVVSVQLKSGRISAFREAVRDRSEARRVIQAWVPRTPTYTERRLEVELFASLDPRLKTAIANPCRGRAHRRTR